MTIQGIMPRTMYKAMKIIYRSIQTLFHRVIDKFGLRKHIFHCLVFFHAKKLPLNANRYLVIAPHPDDEVFGCAGLMHRLNQTGKDVHVVILTQGEGVCDNPLMNVSAFIAKRRELALDAAKALGLKHEQYTFLNWGDSKVHKVHDDRNKQKELISIIEIIKPEVIFTPHITDGHPDHIHATKIVGNILQPSIKLMYYCIWHWYNYSILQWNKSYAMTMSKKERIAKKQAVDTYALPVDENGFLFSGDLKYLPSYSRRRKELFFEASQA